MFNSLKGLFANVGNLLIARNVFDVEYSISEVIPNEVISHVDVLQSLIFRFVLCDGFGSFIVGIKDRKW